MTLLILLLVAMAGGIVGIFTASLLMMAKEADKAMADIWDDEEDA